MHNLFRLASRSSLEGQWYKPRADRELLAEYAAGLLGTTGCPSGEVQTWLRIGDYGKAAAAAAEFRDIFGEGNFFVELMDHGLAHRDAGSATACCGIARELQLPLVATNDLHYTDAADAAAHEALLCVQSGKTLDDPNRFQLRGARLLPEVPAGDAGGLGGPARPAGGVRQHPADRRALLRRASTRAPRTCRVSPCPEGETEQSWFIAEVERGLAVRFPDGIPPEVRKQADYEVGVITAMNFPGYFLVVADFINWAKDNGIRVGPGRGSGAGSMVAYAMRITDLNPLRHGLIFERFLNPDRVSMPDFDVDFDERRRGDVIRYVTEKYGDDRVAQIVTYGTIKAKQAVKDAARVLGMPFSVERPDHQGDAAAGDGQGRAAGQDLRSAATPGTPRAASSARSRRPTRTSARWSRPRAGSRVSSGSGACTPPA